MSSKTLVILIISLTAATSAQSLAGDLESATKAQSRLIASGTNQANGENAVRAAQLRMSQRIQNLGYQLFLDAKKAGIKVENPIKPLEQINRERRNAGVWDLNVASTKDAGLFLLLNELDAALKEPAFALVGYGLLHVEAQLFDDEASNIGRLSPDCEVKIRLDTEELRYSCQTFLSTESESNILRDLKTKLSASIERRAKLRQGS